MSDPYYDEMSDPYAPYGKTTRAHNTISVGGLNQTEADPDTRTVHIEQDLAVVASRYGGGYFPGKQGSVRPPWRT